VNLVGRQGESVVVHEVDHELDEPMSIFVFSDVTRELGEALNRGEEDRVERASVALGEELVCDDDVWEVRVGDLGLFVRSR